VSTLHSIVDEDAHQHIKEVKMPDWIDPMLATLTHEYFDDPDWIYERKLDGERCLIYCDNQEDIRLMSRNKKKLNKRYPDIVDAFKKQANKAFIIDGEIVAFEGDVTSFSKLQQRMHGDADDKKPSVKVYYYVFDLLYYDQYDLRQLPLKERKKILKDIFDYQSPIFYTRHRKENGQAFLKEACKKDWEGLIAKDYTSTYQTSRSKKWLKFKCEHRQEFILIGYTEPQGERIGFGALLIGYYENEHLKYAGKVGTGFTDKMLEDMIKQFKDIEVEDSPLSKHAEIDEKDVHWLKPKLVGEVTFTEWTDDNKLRHPSFIGLRDDKNPKDVVNEEKRGQ